MHDEEIFIPLTLFASIAIIAWKFFEGRHRERMAMIEKGMAPNNFRKASDPLPVLKWGLLAIFVGGGLLAGIMLMDIPRFPPQAVPAIVLLSGGLGLVIYYMIAMRRYRDEVDIEI